MNHPWPSSLPSRPWHLATLMAALCALCLALGTPSASAVPVFVVHGVATDADGAPLDGWTVVVTNETTHWQVTTVVGETTSGVYQVSRIDLTGHAAQVGDTIRADLIGAQGATHASHLRELTDADLSSASIAFDFTLVDPTADPIQTALRAAWLFDEGGGETTRDASGFGYDGALIGTPAWGQGTDGAALVLDGSSYVDVPRDERLNLSGTDFTLAMWVRFDAEPPSGPRGNSAVSFMGQNERSGPYDKWLWWYTGGHVEFHTNRDSRGDQQRWVAASQWVPTVGVWYHISVTRQGALYTHYLDGQPFGGGTSDMQIPLDIDHSLTLGWSELNFHFVGAIDDAAVFGSALSEAEIRTLVREGLAPHVPDPDPTPGLPGLRAFIVYGAVEDANGVAPDGWTVTVENATRGWALTSTVGTDGSGLYKVTQVDLADPVAIVGDTVRVEIAHPGGAPTFVTEHVVAAADLDQATVRIDLSIPPDLIDGAPPTVIITDIVSAPRQDVVIHYELASETKRTLSLQVEFSTDGGATWSPATVTGRTEAITPTRYVGSVVWGSVATLPLYTTPVSIRLTPYDTRGDGTPSVSHEVTIRNSPLPTDALGTLQGHSASVGVIAFAPDGNTLASSSWDGTAKLWDVASQKEIATFIEGGSVIYSVAFSPDGHILATGGAGEPEVALWDTTSMQQIGAVPGHPDTVFSVAFSPDGGTLASGSVDHTVKLWDVLTLQEVATLQHASAVSAVVFSPDGATLASASPESNGKLWDVVSKQEIAALDAGALSVAFSPDGKTLASGGVDATIDIWDVPTRERIATLQGHSGAVMSVAFSPDGTTLASGSADETVKLWDVALRKDAATLANGYRADSVAFTPDGTMVASSGGQGVTLWTSSVIASNRPPAISVPGPAWPADEGSRISFAVTATDPDGDPLRFATTDLPDNAVLDVATGDFMFTPDHTQSGQYTVEFTVNDGRLGTDSVTVEITVANIDLFRLRNGPRRVSEGEALTLSLAANGAVPDDVELTATGLPDNAAFDADTRALSFSPDLTQAGMYDVIFRATQGGALAEEHPVTLTVDDSPAFALTPADAQSIAEGQEVSVVAAKANDASGVVLSALGLPLNATFDAESGALSFTPDYTQAGDYAITVEATQAGEVVQSETLSIAVTDKDVFSLTPSATYELAEGGSLDMTAALVAGAPDTVSLAATVLPPNATFDASTGVLTFAPDYAQAGEVTMSIDALQHEQVVQTEVVTISVTETPVFALSPGSNNEVEEGATLTVTAVLDDPTRGSISLTADGLPANATFEADAGRLTFDPDYSQAGDYAVTIVASERDQVVQTAEMTIVVTETPVFALTPADAQHILEGQSATAQAEVTASAVGDVVLSALDLPANATFDMAGGVLLFAPDYTQSGDYELTVVATQNGVRVGSRIAVVTVVNVPTFALSPEGGATLDEGAEAAVQLVAINGVGADVSFAAEDLPRNATYADGTLRFAPDFSQQGTHTVTFRAVQDGETVDSETVTFTVRNVDVLAITPDAPYTVDEGSAIGVNVVITPQAAGEVTTSAGDLPANAEFDASAGVLTFAPDHSQAGQHSLTIQASQDGVTVEEERLKITVADVNVVPTVTLSAAPNTAAGDIRIAYEITDFDGDPVSLEVEYSDGAWASASVDETVVDTTDYSGAIVWRSRDDIPSTGGVDVRLRVTPSDAGQGDAVSTDAIRLVNLLGDYNDDLAVGFDDLVDFTQAWRTQDASRDIGPATGDTPDLAPRPDGVIDFEDLTTFVRMWNWSADQALLDVGMAMAPTELSDGLAYRVRPGDGDWSVQHVDITDPFHGGSAAARLTVSYDPESVAIRVRAERYPPAVLLTRLDAVKGVLEVQMAWLDSHSGPDATFGLDVTALRPGDAKARVAFDFRDREGGSRRGVESLRLRFEPPPTTTRLLPNYPNPFNPETWIPFALAEPADVVVTIYDASGAAVRALSLGRLTAGVYRDRATAAHWDGRDAAGELVGSGLYVLELQAGESREMRRLVLLK